MTRGTHGIDPVRRAARCAIAATLMVLSVALGAVPVSEASGAATCKQRTTPEGRALIFSVNAYEAAADDALETEDMRLLVERIFQMTYPYLPDVVLLQEVRGSAVSNIIERLDAGSPCEFEVVANAGEGAWNWETPYRNIGQDTAVIMNSDTMAAGVTGYLTNDYDLEDAAPGEPVKVKKVAWAELVEKDDPMSAAGPLRLAVASAHFPRTNNFASQKTSQELKASFTEDIRRQLENVVPEGTPEDDNIHVIAGDLNNHRYVGRWRDETPLYRLLTEDHGYTDGYIEHSPGRPNPIDYIFSTGQSLGATSDKTNTYDEGDPAFYSNHDLRWSVIAPHD